MAGKARWIGRWFSHLYSSPIGALAAVALVASPQLVPSAGAQEASQLQNHVLGIGNCPMWHPQSVEVCKHSLEKVVAALAPRIGAGPEHVHLLINEGASAAALKRKATELSNQLGAQDRLIIFANVPLGQPGADSTADTPGYVLELWASEKPENADAAISDGTWISTSAFAALIHALPAAEVILVLDTNNSHAVSMALLDGHSLDHEARPEALISSSGAGQAANYSADRTISLFAKHLALALGETDGTLLDAMSTAAAGTRQAAIPICASLMENQSQAKGQPADCAQVPEIHDPDDVLAGTALVPLDDSNLN